MMICIYSAKGWRQLISQEIDITGEDSAVMDLTDRIVEALHKSREVYYFKCSGAFSDEAGVEIVRDDLDVKAHELWHEYLSDIKLSTMQGLPIEEASALVVEEAATQNHLQSEHHLASSREFIEMYKRIITEPDSPELRKYILETAKQHSYSNLMRESPDPRFSPWTYITDDAKYLLYYSLCRAACPTLSPKDTLIAKQIYIEALRRVKKSGSLQSGIDMLKTIVPYEVARMYDFPAEHFDIYNRRVSLPEDTSSKNDGLKIELYSSDEEAAQIVKSILENGALKKPVSPHLLSCLLI